MGERVQPSDIFSLGIVLKRITVNMDVESMGPIGMQWKRFTRLLKDMTSLNIEMRPTAQGALSRLLEIESSMLMTEYTRPASGGDPLKFIFSEGNTS